MNVLQALHTRVHQATAWCMAGKSTKKVQQERAAKHCEACLANGLALYRSIARLSAGFCRARRTVGDVGGCEPDVEVSRTDVIAAELRRS